jgi:soluble P-type ATPase
MYDLRIRYPDPGRVELVSRTLFTDPGSPLFRRFVGRLFSVPEVESLAIDRARAEIRYSPGRTSLPPLMRRIAAALGGDGHGGAGADPLHLSAPAGVPVCVRRYGAVLSTWEVRHALPGRLRLRHRGLLGHRGIADVLREELATVPGVLDCRVGLHTGSLVVVYDPRRFGRDRLLRLCESALQKAAATAAEVPSVVKFGVGTTLLALAMAGHYVYPPLLVACALLLVAANVDTFRRAGRALRTGALDVDVAYGTLITLSLLAGDFRAIALTAWCVRTWPLLLDRRLAATRQALAGGPRRLASPVVIERAGRELTAPASALRAGDVATVMRRHLLEATRVTPIDARPGQALANRAATPVLAFAALGGLTGGLGTSMAVLAPNYTAGPGLANPLDRSSALLACAAAGFLVRDEAALRRLAAADAVVVDVEANARTAEALMSGLRARGIEQILLLPPAHAVDTPRLLRRLHRNGVSAAYIGHGNDMAAAREADVAIALDGWCLPAVDAADIVLVSPRLDRTLDLLDLARAHARETRLTHRLGLWPNVLAVGGALMVGSLNLHAALLSNLGALAVYWRGSTRLSDAEADWRARQP